LVTNRAWSTARIASVRSSRTAASPSAARPSAGAPTTLVSPAGISSASWPRSPGPWPSPTTMPNPCPGCP